MAGNDYPIQIPPLRREVSAGNAESAYHAKWMQERLLQRIKGFQDGLQADEEVGAWLTHFGREMLIHIEDISYHNPDMIIFIGSTEAAARVELLQHSSQVNVLLIAVKAPPDRPARRIGF